MKNSANLKLIQDRPIVKMYTQDLDNVYVKDQPSTNPSQKGETPRNNKSRSGEQH